MKILRNVILASFLSSVICLDASATILTTTGQVSSLRVENGVGVIGFAPNWQPSGTCYSRVWVDLSTPAGRAVYATALYAFSAKQVVTIRADDASTRTFGECNLYDIYFQS